MTWDDLLTIQKMKDESEGGCRKVSANICCNSLKNLYTGRMRVSLMLLVLAWPFGGHFAVSATYDFEESGGFSISSDIKRTKDWAQSAAGVAVVTAALAKSGQQCLEIPASQTNSAVVTSFSKSKDGIVFVDFLIRPTADSADEPQITFDGNGALLGFVKNGEIGTVVAVSDQATGKSVSSGYHFDIDDQNLATDWIRVTIRENLNAKTWDLYLDGELKLIDQPLGATEKAKSRAAATLAFYPSLAGVTYVDDVSVFDADPLFADADKDGIPDAVEMANGTNAYLDDRMLDFNSNGLSNIEDFQKGNSLTLSTGRLKTQRRLVYIDNQSGTDSETGEVSYKVSQRGPKRTLRGAAEVKGSDVVFVIMPSDKPYVCPNYPPGLAPDVSYVLLGNATLIGE